MPPLVTEALVLHVMDYLESSRIVRVLTRDGGLRSALARGARRSNRRFGSSLDLFAEGVAELHTRPGRDLDTLAGFDVTRSRPGLGTVLERFTGASALAEMLLRFGRDDPDPELYEVAIAGIDELASTSARTAPAATLAIAWRIVATLGFAPLLDECTSCHSPIGDAETVLFSHAAGGVLCERCSRQVRVGRAIPPAARALIGGWIAGIEAVEAEPDIVRAHQRLLREFLGEHVNDDRPLRAFDVWEGATWTAA